MRLRNHNSQHRSAFRVFFPRRKSFSVSFGFPIFAMLFLGLGGCPSKPVHSDLGKNGLIKPPHVISRDVDTTPPEINPPAWPLTFYLTIRPPSPPPVRHQPNTSEPEPAEPIKAEAPQISPQLSPEERSRAQASAGENMRIAQQNLDSANGKKLSANQQDMADKIRGFLKQAQDAIAASDWNRASSLAEKARLLSDELVKSLRS
ncbi:MAG: hypothetical protein WAM91_15535 [Candidatus Acidiferrales bacterium]